ncbi:hypothetical protein [Alteriqipengyuania lutimaris]|uniref:Uncharacterized protein n=1 Tax=Alteriqipengyuania lutimaris TaxID=1538146 RepID=A0A395LJ07_9SPHN|nr:hypothetical protein [Alteriqipengyuania lutimaris]MBB3034073.1 hypothetical protein [Alteriqipengyuania lutimaris]RDS76986.1 hypothetical protein DL238_04770 [Alteriqipengyuania lutimaris]
MAGQSAETALAPLEVYKRDERPGMAQLPANTEIIVRMNQEVTTKGKTWEEGDQFDLTVEEDVMLGEYIVIPRGTRAVGKITWMTNKGMFGKSGKMDIEIEYLDLGGRRIPLNGTYRQEGEGNTLATVGGVVLVPISGFFITGKSGTIPEGREMTAYTEDAIELAISADAITAPKRAEIATPGGNATLPVSSQATDPVDEQVTEQN